MSAFHENFLLYNLNMYNIQSCLFEGRKFSYCLNWWFDRHLVGLSTLSTLYWVLNYPFTFFFVYDLSRNNSKTTRCPQKRWYVPFNKVWVWAFQSHSVFPADIKFQPFTSLHSQSSLNLPPNSPVLTFFFQSVSLKLLLVFRLLPFVGFELYRLH